MFIDERWTGNAQKSDLLKVKYSLFFALLNASSKKKNKELND